MEEEELEMIGKIDMWREEGGVEQVESGGREEEQSEEEGEMRRRGTCI